MALTEEQKRKLREAGLKARKPATTSISPMERLRQLEQKRIAPKYNSGFLAGLKGIGRDIADTGRGVLGAGREAVRDVGRTFQDVASGEITPVTGALEAVGETIEGVGQAAGEAVVGLGKTLLPKSTEEAISQEARELLETPIGQKAVGAFQRGEEAFAEFEEQYPNIGRSLKGLLKIGIGGVEVTGAGVGARAGKRAVKTLERGLEGVSETGQIAKGVATDITPKAEGLVNFQVTRALDLTQGDVKNISKSTGNEVGEWMAEKNLIRKNKQETQQAVDEYFGNRYLEVRQLIDNVPEKYKPQDIPRFNESLALLKKDIEGVPGFEVSNSIIDNLQKRKTVSLSDVQELKEMIDDNFSLYRATGDPKESLKKESIRKMRSDLRGFIEKEVKRSEKKDIGRLNNEVATARSITQAISDRSTRSLTRSTLTLGDLSTFGFGSATANPLFGAALLFGKKVLETPQIRLRFARWVDAMNDKKKLKLQKELKSGKIPSGLPKEITNELKKVPELAGALIGTGVGAQFFGEPSSL